MEPSRASLAGRSRSGLATAFFSLISLSFGLIGAAQMLNAAQHYHLERLAFDRFRDGLVLEGVSTIALARLLVSRGDGPFEGELADAGVTYQIRIEHEDAKLTLAAATTRAGPAMTTALEAALRGPSTGRAQRLVDGLRADPGTAACVFGRLSPAGGGDRSGPLPAAQPLALDADIDWRAGQRWRVSVRRSDGLVLDRWLLLSGQAERPGLELMRALYRVGPDARFDCSGGVHGLS